MEGIFACKICGTPLKKVAEYSYEFVCDCYPKSISFKDVKLHSGASEMVD